MLRRAANRTRLSCFQLLGQQSSLSLQKQGLYAFVIQLRLRRPGGSPAAGVLNGPARCIPLRDFLGQRLYRRFPAQPFFPGGGLPFSLFPRRGQLGLVSYFCSSSVYPGLQGLPFLLQCRQYLISMPALVRQLPGPAAQLSILLSFFRHVLQQDELPCVGVMSRALRLQYFCLFAHGLKSLQRPFGLYGSFAGFLAGSDALGLYLVKLAARFRQQLCAAQHVDISLFLRHSCFLLTQLIPQPAAFLQILPMAVHYLRILDCFLIDIAVGYGRVQFSLTQPLFFVCSLFHSGQRRCIAGSQALQKLSNALLAQVVLRQDIVVFFLCQLLQPGVALGMKQGLHNLLAVRRAGQQQTAEIPLGQQDDLPELLGLKAQQPFHLFADLFRRNDRRLFALFVHGV